MSNKKCCVPGCGNTSGSNWSLHKFPDPVKDKKMFNMWVYSVGGPILSLEDDHIYKHRRICGVHFEQKYQYHGCHINRLSNTAVPTKNLPGSVKKFVDETPILRPRNISMEASTSQGTMKNLVDEMPILRPIQNISTGATSTSAAFSTLRVISQTDTPSTETKENLDPVDIINSISVTPQLQHENVVTGVQMEDKTSPVQKINPISVRPQLVHKNVVQDVEMKDKTKPIAVKKKMRKRVAVTQAEQALYNKLLQVGVKLSKCRNLVKRQSAKLKAMKKITTNECFLNTLESLPSRAKILTLMQFRETRKRNKGRRFTLQEKILALSIYKQSPKSYRFLRKIFILPSPHTLVKLIATANIRPGINKNTMEQLKTSAEKMKIEDRICVVLFDEMSLKANVAYNERRDKVSGFVTDGLETQVNYADHAQVFMIRGLLKNYKQPVAYTFSQAATTGQELAKQLKTIITELQVAGLIVVATICDQGSQNVKCYKLLLQETRADLLRRGEEPKQNIILINNQEVIPLYDPPHLMKCIRNNLLTKDLKYTKNGEIKVAKWHHITCLHEENPGYKGIRLVPKLTDVHCLPNKIPKMKVKYATQVFSQTVASNMGYLADKGILPPESKETADLLLFFDKLFDSVNGSFGKKKKFGKPLLGAATPSSPHRQLWRYSKKVLADMHFVNKTTNKVETVPTLKHWVWTLDGIELLLDKLKNNHNITSVWLRHLNQDPIENFFGSIRSHGCRNVNPTVEKFESAFTTMLINCLSSVHAPGANCESDNCVTLHEIIITGGCERPEESAMHIPEIEITPLEEKNDPRKIGGLQYVSGYFLKSAKQKVFKGCNQCKNDLINKNESEYIKVREYANKKWLHNPSDSLLHCISIIQDINFEIIKTNLEKNHLKELIKTMVFVHVDFHFIKCNVHKDQLIDYLINLSSRFFIYNYCKDINRILSNRRECDDDEDVFKLRAQNYCRKHLKRKMR